MPATKMPELHKTKRINQFAIPVFWVPWGLASLALVLVVLDGMECVD
jgi:Trk-type K+ transport system membrane component